MKHVLSVSKSVRQGDVFQDFVCATSSMIAGVVSAKGGSSPIVSYIDDKCDIPINTGE